MVVTYDKTAHKVDTFLKLWIIAFQHLRGLTRRPFVRVCEWMWSDVIWCTIAQKWKQSHFLTQRFCSRLRFPRIIVSTDSALFVLSTFLHDIVGFNSAVCRYRVFVNFTTNKIPRVLYWLYINVRFRKYVNGPLLHEFHRSINLLV